MFSHFPILASRKLTFSLQESVFLEAVSFYCRLLTKCYTFINEEERGRLVMKQVVYKKRTSQKHHRRVVSINEYNQDENVKTHVRKSFLYHVVPILDGDLEDCVPEVYINKHIDTKAQVEEFCFRVKGSFVTVSGANVVRVEFSHKLRISMEWKDKAFSPKKSVNLT